MSGEEGESIFGTNGPDQEQSKSDPIITDPNSSGSDSLKNNRSNNKSNSKSKSRSPTGDNRDSFFQEFYDRKKNRPRLSERIFKNRPSLFDTDSSSFVKDFRKDLEEGRKMFFDGVDPFGHFPTRGSSPGPNNGTTGGNESPRMGRAGGFPFDNSARSRFEDLAGRHHPMFSTMRRPQWEVDDPFGTTGNPFNRERNNSGSSGCASGSSTASTGEHEHIIPIRIERSDGTTTKSSVGAKAKAAAAAHIVQHNPISTTPIPMPAPKGMEPMESQPTPVKPSQQQLGPQRSSTEEVRKSQSPACGERSPRAQSAPPESLAADTKFVSSINIESNGKAPQSAGPQVIQLGSKCTREKTPPGVAGSRQIPIFMENHQGRSFSPPQNNGTMPSPANANVPQQQKSSRPAEQDSPPPPTKKPSPPKDPLEKVSEISNDTKELSTKIDEFTGTTKNKEFVFLDEMLTRNLIKLDVIETEGREDVRLSRKDCIKLIQSCIAKLESKVHISNSNADASEDKNILNQPSEHKMEVDPESQKVSGDGEINNTPESDSLEANHLGGDTIKVIV